MPTDLASVIAACARWLVNAYPPPAGALNHALAEVQARQAATLAAHLRYPTDLDAQLLHLLGPGGAQGLDRVTASDATARDPQAQEAPWRSWVDETVVSWAACFLADPAMSAHAQRTLDAGSKRGETGALRRLALPGPRDSEAAVLLRHPDLLEAIAGLHRSELLRLLSAGSAAAS